MKFAILATAVSASNIFAPQDWASIYKGYINGGMQIEQGDAMPQGTSTWTQCSDSTGVFHYTKAVVTPSNIEKGVPTTYDITGTLDKPIHVNDVTLVTKWNGIVVKTVTLPGGDYTSTYELKIDHTIDSTAPSGNYVVTATANGSLKAGENGTVGCVQGKFSL